MATPFDKRAIEQYRQDAAFLPFVAPAPFESFLKPYAEKETLFDRLVVLSGTPGSGKTTFARLFQVQTLFTLQRMADSSDSLAELRDALASCKAYDGEIPRIAGCRLSMESNYRDCWECPYDEQLRHKLMRALISARAMLSWLKGFEDANIDLADVALVGRNRTPGELQSIGGESAESARARAAEVERAAYRVCASLLPPAVDEIPESLREPYAPIDLIDHFLVRVNGSNREMTPLLMLDDVHSLHSNQISHLIRWLAGREISIARWVMTRLDSADPDQILYGQPLARLLESQSEQPGIQIPREITEIRLQDADDRRKSRTEFRKVARQMCRRYLEQIPIIQRHGAIDLLQVLETNVHPNTGQLKAAALLREKARKAASISAEQASSVDFHVKQYLEERAIRGAEADAIGDAMAAILFRRIAKHQPQTSMFEAEATDVSESVVIRPKAAIEHGARVHLWHEAKLPYVYGFDDLADIANENAERFLHFAGKFVSVLQTKIIRGHDARISAVMQLDLLRDHAKEMMEGWNFPESDQVILLANGIAAQCVEKSREPNAPLGAGANAFGIPMHEFLEISKRNMPLARALQFGVAYNVFTLVTEHRTKNKDWCLIELAGPLLLHHGLPLQRGGFLERNVSDIEAILQQGEKR